MIPPPPTSTLFPYTTLFRSPSILTGAQAPTQRASCRRESPLGPAPGGKARLAGAQNRNAPAGRSEEHTSELQSQFHLVCRLLLEKKKIEAGTPPIAELLGLG